MDTFREIAVAPTRMDNKETVVVEVRTAAITLQSDEVFAFPAAEEGHNKTGPVESNTRATGAPLEEETSAIQVPTAKEGSEAEHVQSKARSKETLATGSTMIQGCTASHRIAKSSPRNDEAAPPAEGSEVGHVETNRGEIVTFATVAPMKREPEAVVGITGSFLQSNEVVHPAKGSQTEVMDTVVTVAPMKQDYTAADEVVPAAKEGSESVVLVFREDMSDHPIESDIEEARPVAIASHPAKVGTDTTIANVMPQMPADRERKNLLDDDLAAVVDVSTTCICRTPESEAGITEVGTPTDETPTMVADHIDNTVKKMQAPLSETAAKSDPSKPNIIGRLGQMLSDRRLNVQVADDIEKSTGQETRGLFSRLGKMISNRRLIITDDEEKTAKENDYAIVDEPIDGVKQTDKDQRNHRTATEVVVSPKHQPRIWNLTNIRDLAAKTETARTDEPEWHIKESEGTVDKKESKATRRGLFEQIGNYVVEKELLKKLSNRSILRNCSEYDFNIADKHTDNVENPGVDDIPDAVEEDEIKDAEPAVGINSRIGKIIAEHKAAHAVSEVLPGSPSSVLPSDSVYIETSSIGVKSSVARRSFLQGLRNIVSTHSVEKCKVPTLDDPTSESPCIDEIDGEMINARWCKEESDIELVETSNKTNKPRREFFAHIKSYIAGNAIPDKEPLHDQTTEPLPMNTTDLDHLMQSCASCTANDITAGLTLIDAKDHLPNKHRQ